MTASLSTQLHRSLFALPLLAIAVIGMVSVEASANLPPMGGAGTTIAAIDTVETVALVAQLDCGPIPAPAGALALARMPGDLSPIAARIRCAQ
jgi:hypothetical protein